MTCSAFTLHAEALADCRPCDCSARTPELYRDESLLSSDHLAIMLAAVNETIALWAKRPADRRLFVANLSFYYGKLASHFCALALSPDSGGLAELPVFVPKEGGGP